jgi:hypothetical protein
VEVEMEGGREVAVVLRGGMRGLEGDSIEEEGVEGERGLVG